MKYFTPTMACILAGIFYCQGQGSAKERQNEGNEKIIKDYFAGWAKKGWNLVSAQLFTSAPDDHISSEKFKGKCWGQAEHIQRSDFIKIIGNGNEVLTIIQVVTKNNKIIRNVE